jgi:hypothetical protein
MKPLFRLLTPDSCLLTPFFRLLATGFWLLASGSSLLASVDGTVLNATTGKPQPSVLVTLVHPGAQGMQTLATVKSGPEGQFKFDQQLQPGPNLVQAVYQGVLYTLPITPGSPQTGLSIKVYDASAKPGVASVAQHMILIEPSATALDVSETFLLNNGTNTTFQDPVNGSVRFYLPEAAGGKASVAINSPGGMPIQRAAAKTKEKDIYKVDYPAKPGETRFDVSYSLPPTETFSSKIMHAEGRTVLVTAEPVTLQGTGIESQGQEPQTRAHIYDVTGAGYSIKITGTGSLRNPEGAPAADADNGESPVEEKAARVYSRMYWVLGMAFAVLGLGGVLLYRRSAA